MQVESAGREPCTEPPPSLCPCPGGSPSFPRWDVAMGQEGARPVLGLLGSRAQASLLDTCGPSSSQSPCSHVRTWMPESRAAASRADTPLGFGAAVQQRQVSSLTCAEALTGLEMDICTGLPPPSPLNTCSAAELPPGKLLGSHVVPTWNF